ncbi:FGGY family carbohydrate kinase [Aliiruegeria sabulilitoris]|uniref:FGGY family carbohydrate kinase n=1 Tax=Aliiruegeria sabulilitoris TaxID=1510458 RepID=UPI000B0AA4E4|nr:FGGY family carbohydrate kinase [Aliiruegeria sabulilitoris]
MEEFRHRLAGRDCRSRIDPTEIDAICYDTTCCSVVALDENGNALRPALIWMDVRADKEAEAVLATGDPALCMNGNGVGPVSAEWMLPKSLWIKRNEPEIYDKAYRICEYQDYITYHLTGEWAASLDNAGLRWHYRNDAGGWADTLVKALGMEAMLERWPPRMAAAGELIGTLTAKAPPSLACRNRSGSFRAARMR